MTGMAIRGYITEMNWTRILLLVGVVGFFTLINVEPAFAFAGLASGITTKAGQVAQAFKIILYAGAVLSMLAGAAPMLWGEVRLKWMLGSLAACTVISMIGTLVNAFTQG